MAHFFSGHRNDFIRGSDSYLSLSAKMKTEMKMKMEMFEWEWSRTDSLTEYGVLFKSSVQFKLQLQPHEIVHPINGIR